MVGAGESTLRKSGTGYNGPHSINRVLSNSELSLLTSHHNFLKVRKEESGENCAS